VADVARLFDEYAAAWARGERPDAREYLARAGEGEAELRELLDRFLTASLPAEPTEDEVAAMQAWAAGQPPLLELRVRRGLTRASVVEALVGRLGLGEAATAKVAAYYHRLETGLLDPRGVSERVFAVLADALGARVDELAVWRPPPAAPALYLRASEPDLSVVAPASAAPEEPRDEVDELFTGPVAT